MPRSRRGVSMARWLYLSHLRGKPAQCGQDTRFYQCSGAVQDDERFAFAGGLVIDLHAVHLDPVPERLGLAMGLRGNERRADGKDDAKHLFFPHFRYMICNRDAMKTQHAGPIRQGCPAFLHPYRGDPGGRVARSRCAQAERSQVPG